jgi:hypothetical protein
MIVQDVIKENGVVTVVLTDDEGNYVGHDSWLDDGRPTPPIGPIPVEEPGFFSRMWNKVTGD